MFFGTIDNWKCRITSIGRAGGPLDLLTFMVRGTHSYKAKTPSKTAARAKTAAVFAVSVLAGVAMLVCRGRHVKPRVAIKEAYRF